MSTTASLGGIVRTLVRMPCNRGKFGYYPWILSKHPSITRHAMPTKAEQSIHRTWTHSPPGRWLSLQVAGGPNHPPRRHQRSPHSHALLVYEPSSAVHASHEGPP